MLRKKRVRFQKLFSTFLHPRKVTFTSLILLILILAHLLTFGLFPLYLNSCLFFLDKVSENLYSRVNVSCPWYSPPSHCTPTPSSTPRCIAAAAAAKSLQSCLTLGCHFLSQCMKVKSESVSDSSRSHGLEPTRLLCPWDFPGKSTGVGCHCHIVLGTH